MNRTLKQFCIVYLAVVVSACASVPEVENRLQSMQLHSNMYVVQAGETVESIAYRYQLSPSELEALNPGIRNSIVAGLRINVRPGTTLSTDVRSRAAYAPAPQPAIVHRGQTDQTRSAPQVIVGNEVVVTPTRSNPEIVFRPPVETVIPETAVAQNPTNPAGTGRVIEEIPANWGPGDHLDYEPVASSRAAMDSELQQYVGEWAWPTEGQVAREFAPQEVGGQGVDIAGVPGQNIRAAMAGTVVYSGRDLSGGGNLIIVRHDDSLMTTYSHADQLLPETLLQASDGTQIGSLYCDSRSEKMEIRWIR